MGPPCCASQGAALRAFLARCPEENAVQKAAEFHLGGYLLFARDFAGKTKEEVAQCIRTYQNAAELPMLINLSSVSTPNQCNTAYPVHQEWEGRLHHR